MFKLEVTWNIREEYEATVIGLFEDAEALKGPLLEMNEAFDGELEVLLSNEEISKKGNTITKLHTLGRISTKRLYFIGLGKERSLNYREIRDAFGKIVKRLNNDKIESAAFLLDSFATDAASVKTIGRALAEAVPLASYQFEDYKKKSGERKVLSDITVICEEQNGLKEEISIGKIYGDGTNLARNLVNTPSNYMTPTDLASHAVSLAVKYNMEYEILEKEDMQRLGMGALLAVNQGSDQPPKMIVLKYQGKDNWEDVLSFVGKGITFDTGGYSLKQTWMEYMKCDMAGSAAVLGAMEIIGQMKLNVNVLAVIPSTENMINGSAIKPGDVITSLSGKTIEVNNTDAEGRLILADGISYAKTLGADYIVDVATLTGAMGVSLGTITTGAVANNDKLYDQLSRASDEAGEWIWRFPDHQPYKDMVKSSAVADLNNMPGRPAGSITAGLFLGEFAEETPWVHLDIAATAFVADQSNLGPIGATGVMVRTLASLARQFEK